MQIVAWLSWDPAPLGLAPSLLFVYKAMRTFADSVKKWEGTEGGDAGQEF
jgi:hypothetical protein